MDAKLATAEKPFEYQPLETPDTIRVIHIRSAQQFEATDSIECDIEHIRMTKKPYDALSYEWGLSADDDPVIFLNGHSLTVRRNLFDALLALRRPRMASSILPIWIDTLSINQSETRERNHQVGLMGTIYTRSVTVRVWPGSTVLYRNHAIEAMKNTIYDSYNGYEPVREDIIYPAIVELCQKPYWNRVWVQQEVFLGGEVSIISSWGSSLEYWRFDYLLGLMTRNTSLCGKEISATIQQSAANALATRKRLHWVSLRLVAWLRLACRQDLQTSEPRDLIYAMLGISSDCQDGGIEPDYDKPLIDVYLETIHFCGLHKPGQENKRFRKTLAERLGLSWDSDMETMIQEHCEQKATVRRED